jgi:hypothetical protein
MGEPKDVTAAGGLPRQRAGWVTGVTLHVNDGMAMA